MDISLQTPSIREAVLVTCCGVVKMLRSKCVFVESSLNGQTPLFHPNNRNFILRRIQNVITNYFPWNWLKYAAPNNPLISVIFLHVTLQRIQFILF